jgi:hypothetical protein
MFLPLLLATTQNLSNTITLALQFPLLPLRHDCPNLLHLISFQDLSARIISRYIPIQTYKASIPAATTQIPAPITSNAFIEDAALVVAVAAVAEVAVPVDPAEDEPDFVAVEEPETELEEPWAAQISAETVAVSVIID